MSYPSSPLSPYLGALELQFAPGPFYTFVSLFLMVLYQLKSLHLDDYNLIYSQNKNRVCYKILTAFPLKTQYFPFSQTLHKTNQNQSQPTIQNNLKTIPKLIYNQNKTILIHIWGFPQLKHKNKGVWVYFLPQISSNLQCQAFFLFLITLGFDFHGAIHKSPHSKTLALSIFLKNGIAQINSP